MSAVIRPDELAEHIQLLEDAMHLHAMLETARTAGHLSSEIVISDTYSLKLDNKEVISLIESRLSAIESKLSNRGVALRRQSLPVADPPTKEPV